MFKEIVEFIKDLYGRDTLIPLHKPVFLGNEKEYLLDCINSTFVSSVGKYVDQFEQMIAKYTGAKYAVATVNGTAALHVALQLSGVKYGDEVITQPFTFVATANAISHAGASPVFVDINPSTLGLSAEKLEHFLKQNTIQKDGVCINKKTNRIIRACAPMHTFGHPCEIEEIAAICNRFNIALVEDAAESLGSFYKNKHTGNFGIAGILSFNGNKTITTGGGGMIITNDENFAKQAKHITTTAKNPHPWEFIHDEMAYNYRLTNISAALGVAQMEEIENILQNKKETANRYSKFFENSDFKFINEPSNSKSNYWLNSIDLNTEMNRNEFLEYCNSNNIQVRPVWRLMTKLDMYKNCFADDLSNAECLEKRIVNLPSSYREE